ncbi:MAG: DUF3618 domain-containing protein [Gordonia sp. (in: high G+C Gram-positive bacteria)]|uniref:DUF3618 domain-containing protein n=1 Tax=Gordonia sp. (in: high G+C Gram-positive bacteria) TaxID=84139 RepID=UPI003BB67656
MADDTQRIEQEIAQAREELAATLDQLAVRANPQRIADDVKGRAVAFLQTPPVKYTLMGLAGLSVVIVVRKNLKR